MKKFDTTRKASSTMPQKLSRPLISKVKKDPINSLANGPITVTEAEKVS
jgi:hypothetical protein